MIIKLAQQHTHEGVTYPAGSEVDLPEDVARWLITVGAEQRQKEVEQASVFSKTIGELRDAVEDRA